MVFGNVWFRTSFHFFLSFVRFRCWAFFPCNWRRWKALAKVDCYIHGNSSLRVIYPVMMNDDHWSYKLHLLMALSTLTLLPYYIAFKNFQFVMMWSTCSTFFSSFYFSFLDWRKWWWRWWLWSSCAGVCPLNSSSSFSFNSFRSSSSSSSNSRSNHSARAGSYSSRNSKISGPSSKLPNRCWTRKLPDHNHYDTRVHL